MPQTASVECPQLVSLAASLRGRRELMLSELEVANEEVEDTVRAQIEQSYGTRLAAKWQIESAVAEMPLLARVHVATDDYRVIGAEFGTRPHAILPKFKRALAFQWQGQQMFFARVQHPGTQARNRRESIKLALGMTARAQWTDAITLALIAP